jgi:predicted kinase
MSLTITFCKGAPGSGKSTWAKQQIELDPDNYMRINNDDLRSQFNLSNYTPGYEKLIKDVRKSLIELGLKHNKHLIIDNVNATDKNWTEVCDIAKTCGKDVKIIEKSFYLPLDQLIERDSKREGKTCVGPKVLKKFFKDLGGEDFQNYQCHEETFIAKPREKEWKPLAQDESKDKAVIFDNDGTIALIGNRSPYDASRCDLVDLPHKHVIEALNLYHNNGYKIIFVSGREEKDRAPTERFYKKYFPHIKYELFMRPTSDKRKDVEIKKEIYENHIKNNYFISGWFDDRLQICSWLYKEGFPLFRVNDPESTF